MKFMSVWQIAPEQEPAVRKRFQKPEPTIDGLRIVGRWHECGTAKGYTLIETDNLVALSKYHLYWDDLVDFKIVPVVEDAEMGTALS